MTKPKRKRLWVWGLLLLALAATAVYLLQPKEGAKYVELVAEQGDISTQYSFTGNITAPHQQTLSAEESATVKEVYVTANQKVRSGERLLKLSTGEIVKTDLAGEVVRLNVQPDDVVSAGTQLATVMDVERLEIKIAVDEYDVEAIQLGRTVDVKVNALDQACTGVIDSLDKDADISGELSTYTAVIALDAPEGVLPGMQVEVRMVNESASGVTLLKVDALQFDDGGVPYVLTKGAEGKYVHTYVQTGINDGANIEIVSGVKAGDRVYYTPKVSNTMMEMMMQQRGAGFGTK